MKTTNLDQANQSQDPERSRRRHALTTKVLKLVSQRKRSKSKCRIDLLSRFAFSVDKPGTRVFDDAFSVRRAGDGWQVDVHVADLAAWAVEGSMMSRLVEICSDDPSDPGRLRLPRPVLSKALSLNTGAERFAISISMWFDSNAVRHTTQVHRSVIRCDANLDFRQADRLSDGRGKPTQLSTQVMLIHRFCSQLSQRHIENGVLPMGANDDDSKSGRCVEAIMNEAGFALADVCEKYGIEAIFRSQEAPSLADWSRLRRYFVEHLIELPAVPDSRALATAMAKVIKARPENEEWKGVCLRILQNARFSSVPAPHFALGQRHYVRATSPLRRGSQLQNQQRVREEILRFGGPLCVG